MSTDAEEPTPPAGAPRGREASNRAGELRERTQHLAWYRFLERGAPNAALKRLEADRYLRLLDRWWPPPAPGQARPAGPVLDLGGGTGRLALPLAGRGLDVTLVDLSPESLEDARRAVAAAEPGALAGRIEPTAGTAYDLGRWDDASFGLVLAVELLCYLEEPGRALAEVARVLRPGGHLLASVEGWPGGLLAALAAAPGELSPAELAAACREHLVHREGDLFVRYFTEGELADLVREAGLEVLETVPTHHALEGPFAGAVEGHDLAAPGVEAEVLALEQALATDPGTRALGRAWVTVARRP